MSNKRIPHGAKRLIHEVKMIEPEVQVHTTGEPDGFGKVNEVRLSGLADAKVLADAIDEIGDERIESATAENATSLTVTFVSHRVAETRTPFNLDAALVVVREAQEPEKSEPKSPINRLEVGEEVVSPRAAAKAKDDKDDE